MNILESLGISRETLMEGSAAPGAEVLFEALLSLPPTQVLRRAVVVEVLYDLSGYAEEEINQLKGLVSETNKDNPGQKDVTPAAGAGSPAELLETAPRNSIIARPISQGADHRTSRLISSDKTTSETRGILCYPFFPPHLALPVKPGEEVWLINASPDGDNTISYWMCRIPGPHHVDDVNYTHMDRKFGPFKLPPATKVPKIDDEYKKWVFGFPNGRGLNSRTLAGVGDFEYIVNMSKAYADAFTTAPVPRLTKRPGDLALQGSHNTTIILGQDRGWSRKESKAFANDPGSAKWSNAEYNDEEYKLFEKQHTGTIDIVAGRGRYYFPFFGNVGDKLFKGNTSPETVETTPPEKGRNKYAETLKNPGGQANIAPSTGQKENWLQHPTEGDPNFHLDASRIYVSMATSVDKNFYIDQPGINIPAPFEKIELSDEKSTDAGKKLPAAIVTKSDQIRLIARKMDGDPDPNAPKINGSIRLIKEGDPKDDLAAILMLEDGNIQISGKKIFLGRTIADGQTASTYGGPGPKVIDGVECQPFVRFSDLKKIFDELFTALDEFATPLTSATGMGFGPLAPINSAATTLKAKLAATKAASQKFDTLASERIFGE